MKVVLIAATAVWMVAGSVSAAPAEPEIKSIRTRDGAVVTLRAGALVITQTLGRQGVELRLTHDDDVLDFSGDVDGRVTLARGVERRSFSVRNSRQEDQTAVNAMLAESPAFAAFDDLLRSEWAHTSPVAPIFKNSREMIRVLQGSFDASAILAAAAPAPRSSPFALVRVAQRSPSQCWDTYSRDVVYFTYELQSCLSSVGAQWWNPLATAWCSYEYNLKSSLASVWLLDCFGVWV